MRDVVTMNGRIIPVSVMPAATGTGTIYSDPIDLSGYDGAAIHIMFGTYTNGTHTFTVYEADDDTGSPGNAPADADAQWTVVSDDQLDCWQATSTTDSTPVKMTTTSGVLPVVSSAATTLNMRVGYMGKKKWIYYKLVSGSAATGVVFMAVCNLGRPRLAPAAV